MLIRALVASLLATVVFAPAAGADAPLRQSFTFSDLEFSDAYLSDACGMEIVSTVGGVFSVTLFVDRSAAFVAEVDTVTRGTITWTNPANSASVSSVMTGVSHAVYPDGVAVGNVARVTITGTNAGSLTGVAPPGAGRIVVDAVIVAVDADGVPITAFDTGDIVASSGNFDRATADLCDALT
jgi:hypothetical protein